MSPSFNSVLSAGPFFVICATYIPSSKLMLLFNYGITSLSYADIPIVACSNAPVFL